MNRIALTLMFSVTLLFALYAGGSSSEGPDGAEVFKRLRCGGCHAPEGKSMGPTLKEMAGLYGEDAERLVLFFKGEVESMKTGATTAMMKVQIKKTKALEEAEQASLIQYIMSFK
ncbi:c-type cytochrome [Thermodesulfobacteriota bacterium]